MSINNEKQTRKWDRDREINRDVKRAREREGKEKGAKFSLQIAKRINKTFVLFVPVCCCCFIFCSNFMKSVCALVFICCGSVVVYVSSFVLDTKSGLSKNQITLFSLSHFSEFSKLQYYVSYDLYSLEQRILCVWRHPS